MKIVVYVIVSLLLMYAALQALGIDLDNLPMWRIMAGCCLIFAAWEVLDITIDIEDENEEL